MGWFSTKWLHSNPELMVPAIVHPPLTLTIRSLLVALVTCSLISLISCSSTCNVNITNITFYFYNHQGDDGYLPACVLSSTRLSHFVILQKKIDLKLASRIVPQHKRNEMWCFFLYVMWRTFYSSTNTQTFLMDCLWWQWQNFI